MTAYNCPIYSPKRVVPPGSIEGAILPSVPSYYAYGLGDPNPFGGVPALDGLPVEVVVEVNDPGCSPPWKCGVAALRKSSPEPGSAPVNSCA